MAQEFWIDNKEKLVDIAQKISDILTKPNATWQEILVTDALRQKLYEDYRIVQQVLTQDSDILGQILVKPELAKQLWNSHVGYKLIVEKNSSAWQVVKEDSVKIKDIVCDLGEIDRSNYADISAVVNDETAMNAVVNSETAMNVVANSETAINAIWNSSYRWTYFDSPYIDTVYDNSSTARSILRNILLNNPDIFGDNSIVAYYPFEGNANDYSGNGYHGTWSGTEQYDTGIIGQAAKFDGSSFVTISDNTLTSTAPFSVFLWVNMTQTSDIQLFITKQNATTDPYYCWNIRENETTTDSILLSFETSNVDIVPNVGEYLNTWRHFGFTLSTSSITVYADAQPVASDSISYSGNANYPIRIGGAYWNGSSWSFTFHGLIDSVRIFNRALTDTEVQRLYKLEYLARN